MGGGETGGKLGSFCRCGWICFARWKDIAARCFRLCINLSCKNPMRKNSVFDIASVTKAVATTTAVISLEQRGLIDLQSPVGSYLPRYNLEASDWKKSITIEHLLAHTSGLPAWSDLYRRHKTRSSLLDELCKFEPISKPGSSFAYSDLGFMLLGLIIETVSGDRLDSFVLKEIFRPLKMHDSSYNPKDSRRCVSTEYSNWRGTFVRGSVHDENAYAMGGVSGHAGLFSTAEDLAKFFHGIFLKGSILSSESIRKIIADHSSHVGGYVGLGWWINNSLTPNAGSRLPGNSFGHNGFTGTSAWMDPDSKLVIMLLTNRIHPVREGDSNTSVGIMMARKHPWRSVNSEFQNRVVDAIFN